MLWADTTSGILKIRNAANNAWVELLQLDGTLTMEDGTQALPGLAFRDDLNTGIWSSAADTFNVSTAGNERLELGAATVFNDIGADVDFRIEGDTDANTFYLDASSNAIGLGIATPDSKLHIHNASCGSITAAANSLLTIENSTSANLQFLTPNDAAGQIRFGDPQDNGAGWIEYAHGTNDMTFGANGPAKMTIKSGGDLEIADGNLKISTAGHGINFHNFGTGTNISSNLLDDYEEGTWVPVTESAMGGSAITNNVTAQYTKVGRMIMVMFYITYPTTSDGGTAIMSLPFTPSHNYFTGVSGYNTRELGLGYYCGSNNAYLYWTSMNSALTNAQMSGKAVMGTICYQAA